PRDTPGHTHPDVRITKGTYIKTNRWESWPAAMTCLRAEVSPYIFPFHPIHVRPVDHAVPARSGIITRKIPIALVVRAGNMQIIQCLVDHFHLGFDMRTSDDTRYLCGDLFVSKRCIYGFDIILHLLFR